jgi:hypothetical protein
MPSAPKKSSKSTLSKKEVRHQIARKLEAALAEFKRSMSEKKFKARIKKASKLFSDQIPSANGHSSNGRASASGRPSASATKKAAPAPAKKAPRARKSAAH